MKHYSPDRNYACRISTSYTYRGHTVAILENELIRIGVLLTKGTDIYEFLYKPLDIDFMWRTPWGVRAPDALTIAPTDELATWIDHYPGGWQEILPNGGYPSRLNGAAMGLHSEVCNQPWDYAIVENSPEQVSLRTWVRTVRTPLYLEKTLTLQRNSPLLAITERLVNESDQVVPIMWGHHIALGEPFLNAKCRIDCGAGTIIGHPTRFSENNRLKADEHHAWPQYPSVTDALLDLREIPDVSAQADDQCYLGDFSSGWYAVTDTERQVGFGVVWPREIFPYVWYWQMFGGGIGYPWYGRTYNIGLEPFTSIPNQGIESALESNTALMLQPREERTAWIRALVHTAGPTIAHIDHNGTVTTGE